MPRKSIIIVAAILLFVLLGALAFYFFGAVPQPGERRGIFGTLPLVGREAPPARPTPPAPPGALPPAAAEREKQVLLQIIETNVLAPTLSADGKSLYYIVREDGHIKKTDLEGRNPETVSNLTVLETFEALWSPKKTKLVMRYHDAGAVKTFLNELATGTPSRVLPPTLTSAAWSPDGTQLAYLSRQGETTNLVIADEKLRSSRVVFSTPIPDLIIQWASRNSILLVSKPSGLAPSLVERFDVGTRRLQTIFANLNGVTLLPLPDGSGFLSSATSDRGTPQTLGIYKFSDGSTRDLSIITQAEKCAFDSKGERLFCGVPQGGWGGVMPDEWYRGAVSFSDALVEIDLKTNARKNLDLKGISVDIVNLFASPDGEFLFFQDKNTGNVWRLTLGL